MSARGASARRVLSVCPGVWDLEALAPYLPNDRSARARANGARYEVVLHGAELVASPSLRQALSFDAFRWADASAARFRDAGIAGVIGTGEYPGCMFAALVAERLGLPTPPARRVVALSHKYYSRVLQRGITPEATPAFEPLDPFARRRVPRLPFPLFVKPVKGTMSIRARRVDDPSELDAALRFGWRERLEKQLLLRPFGQLLRAYTDGAVPEHWFIAETPMRGVQITVDGFVERGRATIMGVVDSVMYPGTQSFMRFEYPSQLPRAVQERAGAVTARLMERTGFDQSTFNVELFWDPEDDTLRIIEVNPRMSYQFGDLFERVDGMHSYAVQLALATGEPVDWRSGAGHAGAAASFVMRRFTDARVTCVPRAPDLAAVIRRFPGTSVKVLCRPGEWLSHHDQDVGSFRYAIVNMSASTRAELFAAWAEVERMLPFGFVPAR